MREVPIRHNATRLILGLFLVVVGVLFLLDRMGVLEAGQLGDYWPLVFVALGVGRLLQPDCRRGLVFSLVLIIGGGWWTLYNLGVVETSVWRYWPVVLVLLGAGMMWRAIGGSPERRFGDADRPRDGAMPFQAEPGPRPATPGDAPSAPPAAAPGDGGDWVHGTALMGGLVRRCVSQNFQGGSLTAIMGGCEVDLRGASIASGRAVLDCFALWGGIEVKVPEDWSVVVQGTPLLGAFEDKTAKSGASAKVLLVQGAAVMGGVEIKN